MEEGEVGAQIRVVRCPKCQKFLPELPNYSVYLCGGCGATLQAKKLSPASDASSEKSDGESIKYLELMETEPVKTESVPISENPITQTDKEIKKPEPMQKEIQSQSNPVISPIHETGLTMKPSSSNPENKQTKYRRAHRSNASSNRSFESNSKQEKGESKKPVNDEGPSNYTPSTAIGDLEQDRAVLLRMLEELHDQVKKSREINKNPANPVNTAQFNRNMSRNSTVPNYYPPPHAYAEPIPHYAWRNLDNNNNNNNNYYYGQFEPDPLISYHHEGFYHQPSCACFHCYHRELPLSSVFNHRGVPYLIPNNNNHNMYGPQNLYRNPRSANSSPTLRRGQNQNRTLLSKKFCRPCRPIAGASPFIICYNCYELLQVPKASLVLDNNKRNQVEKLRCGSCTHAMLLKVDASRLIVSSGNENGNEDENISGFSPEKEKTFPHYSFSSGNSNGNRSGSEKRRGYSSCTSPEEPEPEMETETEAILRVPSLPLREHLGNSFSARSEQEKVVLLAENFKQNSVKDVPVVQTEMDLSAEEYPYPGLSQDSFEGGREEEPPPDPVRGGSDAASKGGGGGDSFLANLFKKSFKGANTNIRSRVSINGYLVSDRVVKKAEKHAGPILPGEYWYDYRAGFWGVVGHPCLGMIPPFIEEFNYPMPINCAGGNTGVVVNGRELHRKDLNLLVDRGLPDTSGQSYRIEISGRVWDEASGEELYTLGKLAPTVEKMKRGFGMRVLRIGS